MNIDKTTPMAYNTIRYSNNMVIIETSIFTRRVHSLLDDDNYRRLQTMLVLHPDFGDLIPGGGGLRKIPWGTTGHGKRGGLRIIYYWAVPQERILMLLIYSKKEQDDLSAEQLKVLRRIIEEEYP